jgi:hypothetical protein
MSGPMASVVSREAYFETGLGVRAFSVSSDGE